MATSDSDFPAVGDFDGLDRRCFFNPCGKSSCTQCSNDPDRTRAEQLGLPWPNRRA